MLYTCSSSSAYTLHIHVVINSILLVMLVCYYTMMKIRRGADMCWYLTEVRGWTEEQSGQVFTTPFTGWPHLHCHDHCPHNCLHQHYHLIMEYGQTISWSSTYDCMEELWREKRYGGVISAQTFSFPPFTFPFIPFPHLLVSKVKFWPILPMNPGLNSWSDLRRTFHRYLASPLPHPPLGGPFQSISPVQSLA